MELSDALLERAGAARTGGLSREMLLVERDFGRAVRREFAFPAGVTVDQVRALPAVALLRDAAYADTDTIWFPGWRSCTLTERLVVLAAPAAPADCTALRTAVQDGPVRR
jgi:hypothetical protein